MQVRSLDQQDPLGEEMTIHSTIYQKNPKDRGAWQAIAGGISDSQTWQVTELTLTEFFNLGRWLETQETFLIVRMTERIFGRLE